MEQQALDCLMTMAPSQTFPLQRILDELEVESRKEKKRETEWDMKLVCVYVCVCVYFNDRTALVNV